MRILSPLRSLPLFLVLTSSLLLHAQFQAPTPEELKMTSDPQAPGAAAVYLNIEEITNDPLHYQTFYARIKILTEKGKELATVDVPPYLSGQSKIVDIKGRTIHADGTIIPLTGKPEDLLLYKTKDRNGDAAQVNRKVFTLPSAEVGSILEYSYQIQNGDNYYTSPNWEIQRPYFVHKAHYAFTPFENFMPSTNSTNASSGYLVDGYGRKINTLIWWPKLPQGVKVKPEMTRYTVDVTDIPATPHEEWMPPVESVRYKVFFYYKAAGNFKEFWINDAMLWSKEVDRFAEPSTPLFTESTISLKDVVSKLVAPGDSELDKAKKLYKAAQSLDNTDYSRRKSETERKQLKLKNIRHADEVWAQKSGNSEEIAELYMTMLRTAGLTAYAEKVVNRQRGIFDVSYLSLDQLNDTLVVLNTGGKEIELDPGEKMCPFGTINWRHASAGGLSQPNIKNGTITSAPQQYTDNKTVRVGDVTLDGHGGITGDFRIVMTGQEALYWRQKALTNDEAEVKKQFDKSLEGIFPEGVEAHIDSFTGMDDPDVNLTAVVKAHGTLGTVTSKRIMLPAFFFETHAERPFVAEEKRQMPVDMHYGESITEQVTYHLPVGFAVEGAPQDAKISWPQHASFNTKSATAAGKITIARSLSRGFTFVKPEEYQDLRGFYQKIAASDQGDLVLTAAPAAPKGN